MIMFSLFANIAFCSSITLWLKYGEQKQVHSNTVTFLNYLIATLGGFVIFTARGGFSIAEPPSMWLIAAMLSVITGTLYLSTMFLLIRGIAKNGAGMCTLWAKAGILIPIFTSLILWGDNPDLLCWIGVIITLCAIFLVSYQGGSLKPDLYLVLLMFTSGTGGTMLKVVQKVTTPKLNDFFVFCTFGTAMVLSYIWTMKNGGIKLERINIFVGSMVGLSNALSDVFMMIALSVLPAPIVFPVSSSGTISMIAVVSALLFKEKLTKKQVVALILTIIGIILIHL